MASLDWAENISDWRWISPENKIFAPNPNWFETLPKNYRDVIILKEGNCLAKVNEYLSCFLNAETDKSSNQRYQAVVLFPMDNEEVSRFEEFFI